MSKLLFISSYPNSENEREGVLQRVHAIDQLFDETERAYLEVKISGNRKLRQERPLKNLLILKVNLFFHFPIIFKTILKAKVIYAHALINAIRVLPFYFLSKKFIIDWHGVTPEEARLMGKSFKARVYERVERFVLKRSSLAICVTHEMEKHFRKKYPDIKTKFLHLPINNVSDLKSEQVCKQKRDNEIIYSGGTQAWQNVDLMVDIVQQLKGKYKFVFLSEKAAEFKAKLAKVGAEDGVFVSSVPKRELEKFYVPSNLGLLLRNDDVVNRVAAPTKLVEYIHCGVIPILLQERVGDFPEYGLNYILLENLMKGNVPSKDHLDVMRKKNYEILQRIKSEFNQGASQLKQGLLEMTKM